MDGIENTAKAAAMGESVLEVMKIEANPDVGIGNRQPHDVNPSAYGGFPPAGGGLPFSHGYGSGAENTSYEAQQGASKIESSIGCLRLVTSNKTEYLGAAWMISSQHAMTCAHIGEKLKHHMINEEAAGYLCFTLNGSVHQVPIELPVIHSKWRNKGLQLNPNTGTKGKIPPYDLAIIPLSDPMSQHLSLSLVENMQLRQSVKYVGFSLKKQANAQGSTTFSSYSSQGNIASLTDWWDGAKSGEIADIIHVNESLMGGISGSPLLNSQGQVIGVMATGSFNNIRRGEMVSDDIAGYAIHVRHLKLFYQQWIIEKNKK